MTQTPSATAMARADGRLPDQVRPIRFVNNIAPYASGSTLVEWGNTRVICGVTIDESVPRWMKEQNVTGGWVTAEKSMVPDLTLQRKKSDISKSKNERRPPENHTPLGRGGRAAF